MKNIPSVLKGGASPEDLEKFLQQMKAFFDSVAQKKGPPFFEHLRPDQFSLAILPGDRMITDYEEYRKFHDWWLSNTTGKWVYELERAILYDPNHGTITIICHYSDKGTEGNTFSRGIRIKDNFVKIGSTWFLTESQNTVLETDILLPK